MMGFISDIQYSGENNNNKICRKIHKLPTKYDKIYQKYDSNQIIQMTVTDTYFTYTSHLSNRYIIASKYKTSNKNSMKPIPINPIQGETLFYQHRAKKIIGHPSLLKNIIT